MAEKGWTARVATAAGSAAGTGAAQLGLGYGLGVIVWPATPVADDSVWLGSLGWATWIAASATVIGAVISSRVHGDRETRLRGPWRFALAISASVGALVAVALIALPARSAVRSDTFSPQVTAAGYAVLGIILGLVVAYWAVVSRPVAANLIGTAAWLWALAIAAVVVELSYHRDSATYLTSWQFTEVAPADRYGMIYWPAALLTLGAAFLIGTVAAAPSAYRGDLGAGAATSGAVGPLLVAASFLALAPRLGDTLGPLESAYLIAPYAVLAGLAGSALTVTTARSLAARRVRRAAAREAKAAEQARAAEEARAAEVAAVPAADPEATAPPAPPPEKTKAASPVPAQSAPAGSPARPARRENSVELEITVPQTASATRPPMRPATAPPTAAPRPPARPTAPTPQTTPAPRPTAPAPAPAATQPARPNTPASPATGIASAPPARPNTPASPATDTASAPSARPNTATASAPSAGQSGPASSAAGSAPVAPAKAAGSAPAKAAGSAPAKAAGGSAAAKAAPSSGNAPTSEAAPAKADKAEAADPEIAAAARPRTGRPRKAGPRPAEPKASSPRSTITPPPSNPTVAQINPEPQDKS